MFLKRRTRRKDGKAHVYYTFRESLRVHGGRTIQRLLLDLRELNTTRHDAWQHTPMCPTRAARATSVGPLPIAKDRSRVPTMSSK